MPAAAAASEFLAVHFYLFVFFFVLFLFCSSTALYLDLHPSFSDSAFLLGRLA